MVKKKNRRVFEAVLSIVADTRGYLSLKIKLN